MNKTRLVVSTIIIVVAIPAVMVLQQQQQARASIPGDFGAGYDNGRANAYNAFFSTGHANMSCHSTFSYCLGYEQGYSSEWNHLRSAFAR